MTKLSKMVSKFWHYPKQVEKHPVRVEALVVEDHQDEMDFLVGLLRNQNVVTTTAKNIAATLQILSGPTLFQLAFVDLTLPDGSGIEIVRRIKDSRRMCHVVVTSGSIEKIPLVVGYGYIGILSKPYSVNSIGEVLWKHRLPCSY